MKEIWSEIFYEIKRSIKHIFYVLLVVCWFAIWYAVTSLIVNEWNIKLWQEGTIVCYLWLTIIIGMFYFIYRFNE